jgi:Ser/Thr protein kinase RdoA (MazF antagonist)
MAVAEALGRMHRYHWESMPAPDDAVLDRYFAEIRPGIAAMESATGCPLRDQFTRHEHAFRLRWAKPRGMSLLHGDLNPTNVLTPRTADSPVYFLDRQPFEWSLTYGVAVSDLAYFMIPWWPEQARHECEHTVLRHWYESL